jgi:hypothetical protein
MKSRISRLLALAGAVAFATTACSVNPEQANEAAQRVMTVAAQITPGALETTVASSPLSAAAPAATAAPALVYARCITRGEVTLRALPEEDAAEVAPLGSRSIITAFGRTADQAWVLVWDASEARGWLPATIIGCTAPVEELVATNAGLLLTPAAEAVAEAPAATPDAPPTQPSLALTRTVDVATTAPQATAEATQAAGAATSETATPVATETTLPADTPVPATATRAPATVPAMPARTATPAAAATLAPAQVITVVVTATPAGQATVRDLRCEVTPGTPVNLRSGPARAERLLITLPAGTRFLAQGRNEDASWLYGFTERQQPGWLIASSVECDGEPAQLVEVDR